MDLKDIKLSSLPRSAQLGIAALVAAALVAGFYFGYLRGPVGELQQLRLDVKELEKSVAETSAVASQLDRFKKELAVLEQRLTELRSILPSEKETPQVLRNSQEMAAASALKITRFNPQPVIPRPFHSDWPILIEVRGSYNALGEFFEKISRATRIVNVDNVAIKGIGNAMDPTMTLLASCTVTTFVYREDVVVEAEKPAPAKKGGKK